MTGALAFPRIRPVWEALQAVLLADSALQQVLGGTERVYCEGDPGLETSEADGVQWGRVVLSTPSPIYAPDFYPANAVVEPLVVRAEQGALDQPGYVPMHALEATLQLCHATVQGWSPGVIAGLVRVTFPFYCVRGPQPRPYFDPTRRVWWLSAEYRGEILAVQT